MIRLSSIKSGNVAIDDEVKGRDWKIALEIKITLLEV